MQDDMTKKPEKPDKTDATEAKVEELKRKPLSDKDIEAVKGGAGVHFKY
jgi:hypothetical protein